MGKSKQKTTTENKVHTSPQFDRLADRSVDSAMDAFSGEFTAYGGDRIADFSADELAAQDRVRGMTDRDFTGSTNDLLAFATDRMGRAPQAGDLEAYMNPYDDLVTDRAIKDAVDASNQALAKLRVGAAQSGAYGSGAQTIGETQIAGDTADRLANLIASQKQNSYNNALDMYFGQTDQALQGAGVLDSFTRSDIDALSSSGANQRLLDQAQEDFDFNEFNLERNQGRLDAASLSQALAAYPTQTFDTTSTQTQETSADPLQTAIGIGSLIAAPFTGGASLAIPGAMGSMGGGGSSGGGLVGPPMQDGGRISKDTVAAFAEGGRVKEEPAKDRRGEEHRLRDLLVKSVEAMRDDKKTYVGSTDTIPEDFFEKGGKNVFDSEESRQEYIDESLARIDEIERMIGKVEKNDMLWGNSNTGGSYSGEVFDRYRRREGEEYANGGRISRSTVAAFADGGPVSGLVEGIKGIVPSEDTIENYFDNPLTKLGINILSNDSIGEGLAAFGAQRQEEARYDEELRMKQQARADELKRIQMEEQFRRDQMDQRQGQFETEEARRNRQLTADIEDRLRDDTRAESLQRQQMAMQRDLEAGRNSRFDEEQATRLREQDLDAYDRLSRATNPYDPDSFPTEYEEYENTRRLYLGNIAERLGTTTNVDFEALGGGTGGLSAFAAPTSSSSGVAPTRVPQSTTAEDVFAGSDVTLGDTDPNYATPYLEDRFKRRQDWRNRSLERAMQFEEIKKELQPELEEEMRGVNPAADLFGGY